nr:MAG TPA: hypothetical protein [Caudoviricetes sp.]
MSRNKDILDSIEAYSPAVFDMTYALYMATNGKKMADEDLTMGKIQKILSLSGRNGDFDNLVAMVLKSALEYHERDKMFSSFYKLLEMASTMNLDDEEERKKYRKKVEKFLWVIVDMAKRSVLLSIILMKDNLVTSRVSDDLQDKVIGRIRAMVMTDEAVPFEEEFARALNYPMSFGGGITSLELDSEDTDIFESVFRKGVLPNNVIADIDKAVGDDEALKTDIINTICTTLAYIKGVVYPFFYHFFSNVVILADDGRMIKSLFEREVKKKDDVLPTLEKFDKAVSLKVDGKTYYIPTNVTKEGITFSVSTDKNGNDVVLAFTLDESGDKQEMYIPMPKEEQ